MTAYVGGMVLPLLEWAGGRTLIRGELREILTLCVVPTGLSLDALEAALTAEACETVLIGEGDEAKSFSGYTFRALVARDATGDDCIRIILAKPSEVDRLRAAMDILTGAAE